MVVRKKAIAAREKAKAVRKKAIAKLKKPLVKSRKPKTKSVSKTLVAKDIMFEARALGISVGAAEKFAEKVSEKVAKWAERREAVTEDDINAEIAKEINKYNKDLSFVYKNRGKII